MGKIMLNNQITVKLHYRKKDGDYTGWNAWMWTLNNGGKGYTFENVNGEMIATMCVDGYETTSVSYIVRKGQWETQEFNERRIDVSSIVSGTVHCYVTSGEESVKIELEEDVIKAAKLMSAELDYDTGLLNVRTSLDVADKGVFLLKNVAGKGADIAVSAMTGEDGKYALELIRKLSLTTLYQYKIRFGGHDYNIKTTTVYASKKFNAEFTYDGDDLGAVWSKKATNFKVWAPTAEFVSVALYRSGTAGTDDRMETIPMKREDKGVWSAKVKGDLNGVYYTYLVNVNGAEVEAVDPYARTTGVNGLRGMVIDLASTDPKGWKKDTNPNKLASYTDAVLYELHVRDFSIDENSGVREDWKGKYMALTQTGTKTPDGTVTGLDYLKSLGITHLHLLPIYDYGSVDESRLDIPQFNWGYDPVNYNTPEGSYSTDPFNGAVRVAELKQAVKALHDNGISVVMDVVYNHVFEAGNFCFNKIVPGYFSRFNADGSYSNGSGCGNDTASERPMVRKFIVDSIVYWNKEYHLDGFRFDLVGLLDAITINALVDAVHAVQPDAIFYGEGWTMNTAVEPGNYMATQLNATKTPNFAYFSDTIRDLLAGRNGETLGFASGLTGQEDPLAHCFMATTSWCPKPTQTVNYASCHDNYTLIDKLTITKKDSDRADLIRMNRLAAAIYMTAMGIPFIHAGEEFLREKLDETGKRIENSYNSSDFVNKIRWNALAKEDVADNIDYYRGLIAFRKAHAALRLSTAEEVAENVTYKWITNEVVLFEVGDAIRVIFNAAEKAQTVPLDGKDAWNVCINDKAAGTKPLAVIKDGKAEVAPISAMVLVKA